MEQNFVDAIPQSWDIKRLLQQHPNLSIDKSDGQITVSGFIHFAAYTDQTPELEDQFEVKIEIPDIFPLIAPLTYETGGRIPSSFHTNSDQSLCLGSPARLRLGILANPTLPAYIDNFVIPYLYSYSHVKKYGTLPYGELAHGTKGVLSDYAELLQSPDRKSTLMLLLQLGKKKRIANKAPCPCGSGYRVGKCHHLILNPLRKSLSASWWRQEYLKLLNNKYG